MLWYHLLEINRKNKNEEDQTNHWDTRILTWKTLQYEGKNHGHQPATTFTIFVEYLQEHRDMFRRLTKELYSKILIRTAGLRLRTPGRPHSGPNLPATGLRFAHKLGHLQGIWIIIQQTGSKTYSVQNPPTWCCVKE
jgi:hypothetical protein